MSACCPHPESEHCPGNVLHARVKNQYAQRVRCLGRHCQAPLCCCTSFVADKKPPMSITSLDSLKDGIEAIPVHLYSPFAVRR
jgi:hypothetical protein